MHRWIAALACGVAASALGSSVLAELPRIGVSCDGHEVVVSGV
jgi:hypothetical protein